MKLKTLLAGTLLFLPNVVHAADADLLCQGGMLIENSRHSFTDLRIALSYNERRAILSSQSIPLINPAFEAHIETITAVSIDIFSRQKQRNNPLYAVLGGKISRTTGEIALSIAP